MHLDFRISLIPFAAVLCDLVEILWQKVGEAELCVQLLIPSSWQLGTALSFTSEAENVNQSERLNYRRSYRFTM